MEYLIKGVKSEVIEVEVTSVCIRCGSSGCNGCHPCPRLNASPCQVLNASPCCGGHSRQIF